MRGLIGAKMLANNQALALMPCGAIHTACMCFDLDVIFFARNGRITKMIAGLKPWRAVFGGISAWGALEMSAGWFAWNKVKIGDRLCIGRNGEDLHALSKMWSSA